MTIKEGMDIFLQPIGNAGRRSSGELIKTKVSKVARKYFNVTESFYGRFSIETFLQDAGQYSPNYKAWVSEQDYEDKILLEKSKDKIKNHLTYNKFPDISLEDCNKILAIINKEK